MPNYIRFHVPNACYFFTVITCDRNPILTLESSRDCLHDAFQTVRRKYPFTIEGIVVLPNHIHTLWAMPEGDSNYSLRWNLIKNRFTRLYSKDHSTEKSLPLSRIKKREKGIWQRRFWEHMIRNEDDFIKHLNYIHYNPVKHGYVQNPRDWRWPSFHRYVKLGWYEDDWGSSVPKNLMDSCVGE